jgi:hypothetical protein
MDHRRKIRLGRNLLSREGRDPVKDRGGRHCSARQTEPREEGGRKTTTSERTERLKKSSVTVEGNRER